MDYFPQQGIPASVTWELLRSHQATVSWYKLIWFPNYIPRHCLILWLAIEGSFFFITWYLAQGSTNPRHQSYCPLEGRPIKAEKKSRLD